MTILLINEILLMTKWYCVCVKMTEKWHWDDRPMTNIINDEQIMIIDNENDEANNDQWQWLLKTMTQWQWQWQWQY